MRCIFIETSTERGVVGLIQDQTIVYSKYLPFGMTQSQQLIPFLHELIQSLDLSNQPIDVIGLGIGPGSYTGIRVGVAAGQSLAYAWNLPMIGVSSLYGFIPSQPNVKFAALIDARIGGVYVIKGTSHSNHQISYQSTPELFSLEKVGEVLKETTHFVTPNSKSLKSKFNLHYPENNWVWEEQNPSLISLNSVLSNAWNNNEQIRPPTHLKLLYLRETEAERSLKKLSS
ncbi:MAG: tRNA (adenosine(37)-N6)-threonylcarbamoyltransferase complex dimerization subunit type 1 TsaB [Parachlamydiaceae bacterium]|nr:tRNA (adenosine(37)-N6)-threonylcarbamoyltransferase complex dimerization subunit type 1 TsaB [Parachlamydiaceae bacterium]